jgi:hypothetical protein
VCDDKAAGDRISISGGSFPSGAVIVVVVTGALVDVVVDVTRAAVVGATVVDVDVVVVCPCSTVVVDAPDSASSVVVVAVSAVPNEHPAPSSAKATTTSFHIPLTPRYYAFSKIPSYNASRRVRYTLVAAPNCERSTVN